MWLALALEPPVVFHPLGSIFGALGLACPLRRLDCQVAVEGQLATCIVATEVSGKVDVEAPGALPIMGAERKPLSPLTVHVPLAWSVVFASSRPLALSPISSLAPSEKRSVVKRPHVPSIIPHRNCLKLTRNKHNPSKVK